MPICKFPRVPAVFCEYLRKSAVFCGNLRFPNLEEDKRATTNVQNGLVFFSSFSFIIFSSLCTKTVVKPLNSKKKSWRKNDEKLWKSAEKCQKV